LTSRVRSPIRPEGNDSDGSQMAPKLLKLYALSAGQSQEHVLQGGKGGVTKSRLLRKIRSRQGKVSAAAQPNVVFHYGGKLIHRNAQKAERNSADSKWVEEKKKKAKGKLNFIGTCKTSPAPH